MIEEQATKNEKRRKASLFLLINGNVTDNLKKDYIKKFFLWVQEYNVTYKNEEEFQKRLGIFLFNDAMITKHNTANHSWKMDHNKFSDLSWREFRELIGFERNRQYFSVTDRTRLRLVHEKILSKLPDAVDWVTTGAVTDVKDQGSCGSCWAFSTTGCMEGAYFKKHGKLKSFSEQQLVSCDTIDSGCNGGLMDYAFEWIKLNGGICLELDYPYVSGESRNAPSCKKECMIQDGTTPMLQIEIHKDESSLMSVLSEQPVSVAIEADQTDFQFYSSGIFTGSCGTNLDHGVLVVGYGTDNDINYWKLKNSWGNSWGENGYIRLQRGKNQYGDQCGILLAASYIRL